MSNPKRNPSPCSSCKRRRSLVSCTTGSCVWCTKRTNSSPCERDPNCVYGAESTDTSVTSPTPSPSCFSTSSSGKSTVSNANYKGYDPGVSTLKAEGRQAQVIVHDLFGNIIPYLCKEDASDEEKSRQLAKFINFVIASSKRNGTTVSAPLPEMDDTKVDRLCTRIILLLRSFFIHVLGKSFDRAQGGPVVALKPLSEISDNPEDLERHIFMLFKRLEEGRKCVYPRERVISEKFYPCKSCSKVKCNKRRSSCSDCGWGQREKVASSALDFRPSFRRELLDGGVLWALIIADLTSIEMALKSTAHPELVYKTLSNQVELYSELSKALDMYVKGLSDRPKRTVTRRSNRGWLARFFL